KDSKNHKNKGKGKANWFKNPKHKTDDTAESSKGGGSVNSQGKKKFDKSKIKCYSCGKFGHFADECWFNKDQQDANVAAENNDANAVLMMATTCDD
ncbi:F-box protein, partial [Trifolium medium]|nr:F-box protein [Trifolium medium]